jgi:hypothetical protein
MWKSFASRTKPESLADVQDQVYRLTARLDAYEQSYASLVNGYREFLYMLSSDIGRDLPMEFKIWYLGRARESS